jgi:methionyl-tRNA formyltransferase
MQRKVTVLCGDVSHPVNSVLHEWASRQSAGTTVELLHEKTALGTGDLLVLVSCHQMVEASLRERFGRCVVIHASDLPLGRGWSPHIWQILEGRSEITVTLLDAADKIDTGDIWKQVSVQVSPHALWDEINRQIFATVIELLDYAVENWDRVTPKPQRSDIEPTYYRRRTPADSRLDPDKTLAEQFNLLRVCDPERYPAYFELFGERFVIRIEKK